MLSSRFCLNAEERRTKFKSLDVREASSAHLKVFTKCKRNGGHCAISHNI
jgi:hypothetical protein